MQADFHSFIRTIIRQKNYRRFFSTLMALMLLLGNLQLASASSGDSGRVSTVSNSVMAQAVEPTAQALALAMGVPQGDIIGTDLMGSDVRGVAVITTTLGAAGFPTDGPAFAVLSTGLAADVSLPNTEEDHQFQLDGLNNSQGNDLVRLHLQLKIPDHL